MSIGHADGVVPLWGRFLLVLGFAHRASWVWWCCETSERVAVLCFWEFKISDMGGDAVISGGVCVSSVCVC